MPAGPALSPRGGPANLSFFLLRFPECEIKGVPFFVVDVDAGARFQLLEVIMRQAAVMREGIGSKIDIAVGFVGVAFIDERPYDFNDFGDILGRARMHGRRTHTESPRVSEIRINIARRDFGHGAALGFGLGDHFIVHVGKILDEHNIIAAVFKIAAQHIEKHKAARVADMDIVVHRGTAGVHPYPAIADGQFFLLSGERIKKPHARLSFSNYYFYLEGSRKSQYCLI